MKSKLTLEIEEALRKRAINKSERYAFEVPIKGGIVDFVTSKMDYVTHHLPRITCYEVKVSFSDFKSENGHNFYGEENYYVMPQELLDDIINKKQQGRLHDVGIIIFKDGKLRKKLDGSRKFWTTDKLNIEDKFQLMDNMIMRILSSGK